MRQESHPLNPASTSVSRMDRARGTSPNSIAITIKQNKPAAPKGGVGDSGGSGGSDGGDGGDGGCGDDGGGMMGSQGAHSGVTACLAT